MNHLLDALLVCVVLLNFFALGTSRVMAVIRASALQGVVLACLVLFVHPEVGVQALLLAAGTFAVKALAVPLLLMRASATKPRNRAGSASHANVTSRAAPMPSNGDPVSSAAEAVKKRPSASR